MLYNFNALLSMNDYDSNYRNHDMPNVDSLADVTNEINIIKL